MRLAPQLAEVTLTFDRVYDVAPNGRRGTLFSFQHGGANEYGVAVEGEPAIVPGMTVTALLREKGNWQSLVGWFNHDTGEIVCQNDIASIAVLVIGIPYVGFAVTSINRERFILGWHILIVTAGILHALRRASYAARARSRLQELKAGFGGGKP